MLGENALGGTRTHGLSLRRAALYPTELQALDERCGKYFSMVPKEGFEPTHPFEYYVLNVARLPFRHFGLRYIGKFAGVIALPSVYSSANSVVGGGGVEPPTSCV